MSDKEELCAVYAHADRMDDRYMRAVAERDALAAELAALKESSRKVAAGFCTAEAGYIRRVAALEAEYKGFRDSASDTYKRLAKERVALEAAIRGWMHEGRMQTFGDRERMRAEMASCLPVETLATPRREGRGIPPPDAVSGDGPQSETPVSTLCAVCDQIKELHPSTHPWTPRPTAETGVKP